MGLSFRTDLHHNAPSLFNRYMFLSFCSCCVLLVQMCIKTAFKFGNFPCDQKIASLHSSVAGYCLDSQTSTARGFTDENLFITVVNAVTGTSRSGTCPCFSLFLRLFLESTRDALVKSAVIPFPAYKAFFCTLADYRSVDLSICQFRGDWPLVVLF